MVLKDKMKFAELTDIEEFEEWKNSRPKIVKEMIEKYPPNLLYLYKPTNHRVTIYSYSEDGTATINCTGEYNKIMFGRQVFGIDPNNLEECDLPADDEELGEILTEREDQEEYLKILGESKEDKIK